MPVHDADATTARRVAILEALQASGRSTLRAELSKSLAEKWGVSERQIRKDLAHAKRKIAEELTDPVKRREAIGGWRARLDDLTSRAIEKGDYSAAATCLRLERDALGLAEHLEMSGPGGGAIQVVTLTPEQARLEADRARRIARGEENP